jgi:riboflavin biosynthesis pyrimidine reductase
MRTQADAWAVVLDAGGKIAWGRSEVGGDPLVVVLTQAVGDSHLAGLDADGISYIIAGEREIELVAALETLNRELGIRRLLLEGGGGANGALLQAGLVDELSLLIAPSVEGVEGGPAVFDIHGEAGVPCTRWEWRLTAARCWRGLCVVALPLLVAYVTSAGSHSVLA